MSRGQFVGRAAELACILADAPRPKRAAPTPAVWTVAGGIGAGKSRLLEEISVRLGEDTARPPLPPIRLVPEDDPADLLSTIAAALCPPELITPAPARVALERARALAAHKPVTTIAVADSLADLITSLVGSTDEDVVLLLDDVHRASEQCLAVLDLALAATVATPWLLVLARRTDEPTRSAAAAGRLAALEYDDRVMILEPLNLAETTDLINAGVGAVADAAVITAIRQNLGPLAGCPGAVLDLLAELRRTKRLRRGGDRVYLRLGGRPIALPATGAHRRMLAGLPAPAAAVFAAVAAVGGVTVKDCDAMAAALAITADGVMTAVDSLTQAGFLTEHVELLRPAVPAIACAASTHCPPAVVAHLATLLLAGEDLGHDPARVGDLIVWSRPSTVAESTVRDILVAAQRELACDPARVARWCGALAEVLPTAGALRCEVLHCQARAHAAAGEWHRCGDAARQLVEEATTFPELRSNGLLWLTSALVEDGDYDGADVMLRKELAGTRGSAKAPLYWQLARLRTAMDDLHGVDRVFAQASDDPDVIQRWPLHFGQALLGGLRGSAQEFHDGLDRLATAGFPPVARLARESALHALAMADFRSVELALIPATPTMDGVLQCYRDVRIGFLNGGWDDALRAAWALRSFDITGSTRATAGFARAIAAEICCRRGANAEAAAWLADSDPQQPFGYLIAWSKAGLMAAEGNPEQAVRTLSAHIQELRDRGHQAGLELLWWRLAEIAGQAGLIDHARRAAQALDELATSMRAPHAQLYALLGNASVLDTDNSNDTDGAARRALAARQAAALAETLRLPFEQATALVLYARWVPKEHAALATGYRLLLELDAQPALRQCAALLTARGYPLPLRTDATTELSLRECQVGNLVAEGLSNRQIARRLRLTEKTIEGHITRLLRKTTSHSRVELALHWPPDRTDL